MANTLDPMDLKQIITLHIDGLTFTNGNRIVYTYDAAGIKLKKEVFEGNGTTTTYYHGSLQFVEKEGYDTPEENHARMLDFIMTDEGRAVPGTSVGDYDYEYFLKDHLGNTRAVVTTADNAHTFTADMETEDPEGFENVNETRHQDALYNRTPNGSYMSYLNPMENGHVVGPALSLKVQPGDSVKMEAYVQYNGSVSTGNTVEGVASAIAGAFGYAGTAETQYILDVFNGAFAAASLLEGYDDNYPRIYLQYLHFDEHFGLIDYGYQQVGYGTLEGSWEKLSHQQLVTEEGYYYIYVVNESEDNIDAFFDDISVEHIESKVALLADYYPFGMQIKQTSTDVTNPLANKYLHGRKEIQSEFGLNWYDYWARRYDPSLGRWGSLDPVSLIYNSNSPYHYVRNNPVRYYDLLGLMDQGLLDQWEKDDLESNGFNYNAVKGDQNYVYQDEEGNRIRKNQIKISFTPKLLWSTHSIFGDYYQYGFVFGNNEQLTEGIERWQKWWVKDGKLLNNASLRAGGDTSYTGTPDWLDKANTGVGFFMIANSTKEQLITQVSHIDLNAIERGVPFSI
jgi:RHS repeat-associated protein